MTAYLNGKWSNRGWWYYYLYATLLKVPLGIWLASLLLLAGRTLDYWRTRNRGITALTSSIRASNPALDSSAESTTVATTPQPATWQDEAVVLAPAVVLRILVSSQTGINRYFRYLLPAIPFAYVWLGQVGHWLDRSIRTGQSRIRAILIGSSLVWTTVSSLSIFPHSMSYFNELAGGPRNGHLYLIDANIDWGQDIYFLRQWITKHPDATPLHTMLQRSIPVTKLGVEQRAIPLEPTPGWFAVSIHRIHDESGSFLYFLKYRPNALAGYPIYIYHVPPDEANRVRRELIRSTNNDTP